MDYIRDMLYVKSVERTLRRPLTEEEMDGQPFMARLPNGNHLSFCVPLLQMPWDLMPSVDGVYMNEIPYSHNKLAKLHDEDRWVMKSRPPEYLNIWEETSEETYVQL